MALNCFSPEQLAKLNIVEFETYYHAQTYYGQVVDLYKVEIEDGFYIEGKLEKNTVFTTVIKTK
jgi:hypothetical protein